MKRDPYFKFLVIIVLAGLVTAIADPTSATAPQPAKVPAMALSVSHGHKAKG